MKNLLKKLNISANHGEEKEGSRSSRGNKLDVGSFPDRVQHHLEQNKPISAIVGWFNSVTNRNNAAGSPSSSPSRTRGQETNEQSETGRSNVGLDAQQDVNFRGLGTGTKEDRDLQDEYQMKLAMEMSVREDPEAVQIEAVKQISLGCCPPGNSSAEVVAYRYWHYNSLSYDDKVLDGFYDLYGIVNGSSSSMPHLVDLQGEPVSEVITWEAILVNKLSDSNLQKLQQKAMDLAVKERARSLVTASGRLVQVVANLVSEYMGGPVGDPVSMLRAWRSLSYSLKSTLGSMVLPLGSLTIGLARHRALLFKVLADSISLPCRLVKGQCTGSDDVAMVFVKIDDGREFIVDLMADPGMLIPSDVAGINVDHEGAFSSPSPLSGDAEYSTATTSNSGPVSSFEAPSVSGMSDTTRSGKCQAAGDNPSDSCELTVSSRPGLESGHDARDGRNPRKLVNSKDDVIRRKPSHPFLHARSPSWTEGVSSPAVRKMKVKDVSQYMIDAAKENPQLARKLHDVLLESGVVAPANLFSQVYSDDPESYISVIKPQAKGKGDTRNVLESRGHEFPAQPQFLPPLPQRRGQTGGARSKQGVNIDPSVSEAIPSVQLDSITPAEGPRLSDPQDMREVSGPRVSSDHDMPPQKFEKSVPVAAAVAAAAVVASSMIVAVAKTGTDANIDLPIAAAASATAAAVVATTAAVGKQYEQLELSPHSPSGAATGFNQVDGMHSNGDGDHDASDANVEAERVSDRSAGADSQKSDSMLDDIADFEIPWEEITLGERIGLGSHGEVYHADWHGTEVAVKRFLDQDISGELLEEFRSEVSIMKRLRHPNVVLFMGAVTRPPNLSIITEFLPRGSLYRLIHRSNNHLDERRRLKMALDAARGMNYLHTCSPVIVHRDLKSPNLLVDRNWVVKVCDFGLSRMKHSTFLSSRSTAGTAEWMAPEVLRNEPSNEKCDVYSFGVILWELFTLQQPWGRMNAMQVVGAVGFQHRRLDIPNDVDPTIADLIRSCWQTDPKLRPSFSEIMGILKPLQKAPAGAQATARSSA